MEVMYTHSCMEMMYTHSCMEVMYTQLYGGDFSASRRGRLTPEKGPDVSGVAGCVGGRFLDTVAKNKSVSPEGNRSPRLSVCPSRGLVVRTVTYRF